jgi:GH15 family glucan-1,4-alpha-glucosidase
VNSPWQEIGEASDPRGGDLSTLPIHAYAIIGDCQTAALVGTRGAIEWLCLPRFDSPSVFAAIIDPERGGRMQVRPRGAFRTARAYIPGTPVLQSEFSCDQGSVRVTDFMPMRSAHVGVERAAPMICRLIEGVAGAVDVRVRCDPRPAYAQARPAPRQEGGWWVWSTPEHTVRVCADVELSGPEDDGLVADAIVRAGSSLAVLIDGGGGTDAAPGEPARVVREHRDTTVAWWRRWGRQLRYSGPHADHVLRSAITLKLLCYKPTGAAVSAATTSLPEIPGGTWNWDYRYCWLRDASMTVRSLLRFGFADEAHGFLGWLLGAAQLPDRLRVLYDIDGGPAAGERKLGRLRGYGGARPVRVGNNASAQLQLDTYGAVADAFSQFVHRGGTLTARSRAMLQRLGEQTCDLWSLPDNGIWESRLDTKHHTLSKGMCWVALQRLLEIDRRTDLSIPVERFERVQQDIRDSIEMHGVAPTGHYRLNFREDAVDPSLLLLSIYGYEPATSERMMRTLRRIDRDMGPPPLLGRHAEAKGGEKAKEIAFGIAGFWAVECLAGAGLVDEAEERFEALLRSSNELGLFAEEIDRETGHARGNFPQGYSHIGLLNAAAALARSRRPEAPGDDHDPRTKEAVV